MSQSMTRIITVASVMLASLQSTKAVNVNVEPKFLGGPCDPYGRYVQSMSTGNGMVQSLSIAVTGTGMFLDDLVIKITTVDVSQRGAYPYSYIAFHNESDRAGYGIWCTDEDGIITRPDGWPLRIRADRTADAMLVTRKGGGFGLMPEPYAHYVDGKRLDGIYLGLANRTTWAFSPEQDNGVDVWKPRLLIEKTEPKKGEVQGYLKLWG